MDTQGVSTLHQPETIEPTDCRALNEQVSLQDIIRRLQIMTGVR
jgi:hypothetical protein